MEVILNMSIIENARALGDALSKSDELAKLKNSEIEMQNDEAASEIVAEFHRIQQKFHQLQMEGRELTEAEKKEAEDLEAKMGANEKIKAYMEAQNQFEQILRQVNSIISSAISGQQCGDSSSSCSSGCSGCN